VGQQVRQLLATLCVALSLTLVALTQLGESCLRILSFGRPHDNHGVHLGYDCCIL
jgi:hypothetical protein